ncbi:bacteriohemerythrin [Candidatus Woesearchaeota archaeon]|nr:bacteriohemerythrin [Candidatus Woesearchaeota archaeon]MCF7901466.1 bacteriohemerythrin [Candidatus Woesearchaeota archaeon]MCF8013201.1 bacteriohemerythrin [Candidatus Woesearchaeota archaeon]
MDLIEWKKEYSVNVKEIDEQHKKLIKIINKLNESINNGTAEDILAQILFEMEDYTIYHFRFEEQKFKEYEYEQNKIHRAQHKFFENTLKTYKKEYALGNKLVINETLEFLKNWLLNHIQGSDKLYSECFNKHGLK